MLSAPEPNNTFDHAYTPPDNIYLEQQGGKLEWITPLVGPNSCDSLEGTDEFHGKKGLLHPSLPP